MSAKVTPRTPPFPLHPYCRNPPPTESYSIRCGLSVDPEAHPGNHHQKAARHVNVNQEVAHVTSEHKAGEERRVELTWRQKRNGVGQKTKSDNSYWCEDLICVYRLML